MDRDKLKQEISAEEGCVPHAYTDDMGYLTIGIGRLIDARKGGKLTTDEIMLLFNNDVDSHRADIAKALPWAARLSDARQRALVNMCFQMGIGGVLEFRDMLFHLQTGDFDAAAASALDSAWAKETPNRAGRVADMIKNG